MVNKKQMMITGSNRGLGAACVAEFFDYELITVSRHDGSTAVGDLQQQEFLQYLVDRYDPDVLINNAGIISNDLSDQIDVNFHQAAFLTVEFYNKMKAGSSIINVTSTAANISGWKDMRDDQMFYNVTKSALKNLSNTLSRSKRRPVKVTSLEPGFILTDFANIKQRWESIKDDIPANHIWSRQAMLSAEYIAKTIRWIVDQPFEIASLEILNSVTDE